MPVGPEVLGVQLVEMDAGEVQGKGDREESHGGGHGETRLKEKAIEAVEVGAEAWNPRPERQHALGVDGTGRLQERGGRRGRRPEALEHGESEEGLWPGLRWFGLRWFELRWFER